MGLFGKLFEKKECAFCGGEIGMFGNRKLEDGNMCKTCAAKLSPWFDDRRHSTVAQISEQLAYRETNKAKVAAFRTTRSLGDRKKVLLDEDAGLFMVTDADTAKKLEEQNPDVLALTDVTGCIFDIDESYTELKKDGENGQKISYNPPRYRYDYDFYIKIQVNNPYFDEMRIRLNNSSVEIIRYEPQNKGMSLLLGAVRSITPETNVEYVHYKEMGEEIRDALLNLRKEARDSAAAASAPPKTMVCPCCGATTTVGAAACCEYCGVSLK